MSEVGWAEKKPDRFKLAQTLGSFLRSVCRKGPCRPTHDNSCARLRQTIPLPVLPFCSSAVSCMFLIPCIIRDACVPPAAAGLRLERPPPVACACVTMVIVDLIEITGFRLQLVAMLRVYPACQLTSRRRDVRGRRATAVALLSHGTFECGSSS